MVMAMGVWILEFLVAANAKVDGIKAAEGEE
jgi:hypothetical protein